MAIQPDTTAVSLWEKTRKTHLLACASASVILLNACSSNLVLSAWVCKQSAVTNRPDSGSADAAVGFSPWTTSFENGFCDYFAGDDGSCYFTGPPGTASYTIVEAPVHSGHYAAAFTVIGHGTNLGTSTNSRCHRDGELPRQAYYKVWYYVPTIATNSDNWNLIHFQGAGPADDHLNGLWDISLVNNANGGLRLTVKDYVENSSIPDMTDSPPIPIGSWFEIKVFLKRAADATGEVAVYQDGVKILQATNLITDNTTYGQWYVGNLATDLDPAESTVYVDDVAVGLEP